MAIIQRKAAYGVRVHVGGGKFDWVGSVQYADHNTKAEAYEAAQQMELDAKRALRKLRRGGGKLIERGAETCDSFARRWPDDYRIVKQGPTRGRPKSAKTIANYRDELKPFIEEFKGVPLRDLDRQAARKFADAYPRSAVVVRGMLADALDDQIIDANPFQNLRLEQSRGRRDHAPITQAELEALADTAIDVHGEKYGQVYRAFILFTGYVGARLEEGMNIEWRDVRIAEQEVDLRITKFDKPRTVLLRPEAIQALQAMPRRVDVANIFYGKRNRPLTKGNHQALWTPIRAAWWKTLTPERRLQIVPPDSAQPNYVWHSLRHFTGHWFYIGLGLGSELAAYQLGHADPSLIEKLYGHPFDGALARLKRSTVVPAVVPLRASETQEATGA